MVESLYLDLKARPDLEVISRLVDPGHRVLDLGCGDGIFLKMLREKRGAEVLGILNARCSRTNCRCNAFLLFPAQHLMSRFVEQIGTSHTHQQHLQSVSYTHLFLPVLLNCCMRSKVQKRGIL